MKVKLEKSGYELELIDELTGALIIQIEKDMKRSLDIEAEIEQNQRGMKHKKQKDLSRKQTMKFGDNVKLAIEYLPELVVSAKDKTGKAIKVDEGFVPGLGATDYRVLEKAVNEVMETGSEGL